MLPELNTCTHTQRTHLISHKDLYRQASSQFYREQKYKIKSQENEKQKKGTKKNEQEQG